MLDLFAENVLVLVGYNVGYFFLKFFQAESILKNIWKMEETLRSSYTTKY